MSDERKAKRKGKTTTVEIPWDGYAVIEAKSDFAARTAEAAIDEVWKQVYEAVGVPQSMYVGPEAARTWGVKPGWHHPHPSFLPRAAAAAV